MYYEKNTDGMTNDGEVNHASAVVGGINRRSRAHSYDTDGSMDGYNSTHRTVEEGDDDLVSGTAKGDDLSSQYLDKKLLNQDSSVPVISESARKTSTSKKSNNIITFINCIKANVGAGILGMPFAFLHSGLWLGLGGIAALLCITVYCIFLLVRCKEYINEHEVSEEKKALESGEGGTRKAIQVFTYGDIAKYALGSVGTVIVDMNLFFTQGGFCCAYLIFIGDNLHSIYQTIPIWAYILMASAILLPIVLIRNIRYLSPFSLISEIALLVGMGVVFYYDASNIDSHSLEKTTPFNIWQFPIFFGITVYSFEGIGLVLPIQGNMKSPQHFKPILLSAIGIISAGMALFGFFGYLAFGPETKDIITLNLPQDSIMVLVVKIGLMISLLFTYPIQLFPLPQLFDGYINKIELKDASKQAIVDRMKWHLGNGFRLGLLCITTILAIVGQDVFGLFLSLIGGWGGSLLAYIFPSLIHFALFFRTQNIIWSFIDLAILLFGICGACLTSVLSVKTIVEHFAHMATR